MAAVKDHTAEWTRKVKEYALTTLQLSDIGIARADALEESFARYQLWLQYGYHGLLEYMARNQDKRRDPRHILPTARSVIVVAQNYYTPHRHQLRYGEGKISRYAWGKDYHKILSKKLKRLARFLTTLDPEVQSRFYVDTGPVLEKQWAVQAGIGWQGKHSNVISRKFGSWFFIGVLLTSLPLEPDAPIPDFCGRCTACLDACPTGAITQPYVVDARRCISYWTIEVKPEIPIPDTIAEHLEGWLFGCDICQEVCPWNRFQQPTIEQRFHPQVGTTLPLEKIEAMNEEEFHQMFQGTPVKRAKLAGLKRTARALRQWWNRQIKRDIVTEFHHKTS